MNIEVFEILELLLKDIRDKIIKVFWDKDQRIIRKEDICDEKN